jgi:hypothetical protein
MIAASGAFGTVSLVQGHEVPVSPGHEAGLLVSLPPTTAAELHSKGVNARSKAFNLQT